MLFSRWVKMLMVGLVFGLSLLMFVSTVLGTADTLVWQGTVYSSGVEVVGPVLTNGARYVIVAKNTWWYKKLPFNLAADAMYYTTDPSDSIFWGNHFPEPGGHSFLQVDRLDVDWGPFSNGDTGHTYTLGWNGSGTAVSFRIVDWMDIENYENNECHIDVWIYAEVTVGGRIGDEQGQVLTYFAVTGIVLSCVVTRAFAKKICG